jgi:hypothetical protein
MKDGQKKVHVALAEFEILFVIKSEKKVRRVVASLSSELVLLLWETMPRSFYRLSNLLVNTIQRGKHTMVDSHRKFELSENIASVKAAMATVPHHEKVRKKEGNT